MLSIDAVSTQKHWLLRYISQSGATAHNRFIWAVTLANVSSVLAHDVSQCEGKEAQRPYTVCAFFWELSFTILVITYGWVYVVG